MNNTKDKTAYKTIGEAAKELNLIEKSTGKLQTHTIRYWETQFTQIKPTIKAGNRRYYSPNDLKIISFVKYLLKEKGLTIKGVKKVLKNSKSYSLDDSANLGVYNHNFKTNKVIKDKIKSISKIIKDLKNLKNG
jgi:DNA-binding transcriptional MerR regulator